MPDATWILHLDMDAFFASVEQLDDPLLRGKPVIIGGEQRGVVSTASYEARVFGVRSAMPMFEARRRCPQGVFLRGRMERYSEKSREILEVLRRFSPLVEPASIDEAYLDFSGLERLFGPVREHALNLQRAVLEETGLSCSLGLAPVKFLAKIASDLKKPGGLSVLAPEDVPGFLQNLPVGRIPGVGPRLLAKLEALGVRTAADVRRLPGEFWQRRFGKAGEALYDRAGGIDPRPVQPRQAPKSESAENTFAEDTADREVLSAWLLRQAERVGARLRRQNLAGRTITLIVKYADFTRQTRSRTLDAPVRSTAEIHATALDLLREIPPNRPLRLIGVGVSHFGAVPRQLSLLPDPGEERRRREESLDQTLDVLRDRFGRDSVVRGKLFKK